MASGSICKILRVAAVLILLAGVCQAQDPKPIGVAIAQADLPGVVADGKTDCTAALQKLLDSRRCVRLPAGDYLAGSLVVNWHLTGDPGAFLIKNPNSDPGQPLVRGNDRRFSVSNVTLRATKPTPNGIGHVGPVKGVKRDIVFWNFSNVTFEGVKGSNSTGLMLTSSEPMWGGSNYAGQISGCLFVNLDYGIRAGKFCNGHSLDGNRFHQIAIASIDCEEVTGWSGRGGFVHYSHNSTVLKLRKCGFMQFDGLMAEPGGPNGRYLETDDGCFAWSVKTQVNCTLPSILKGKTWTYETHGKVEHGPQK